jgi:hypothetical protein
MTFKKCLRCNRNNRIEDMRYSKVLKRYICKICDKKINYAKTDKENKLEIKSYFLEESKEILKEFNFDDLAIFLTFDLKTNKFKEMDIELEQYEETFCKTLNKEVSLKLLNFLQENLSEFIEKINGKR